LLKRSNDPNQKKNKKIQTEREPIQTKKNQTDPVLENKFKIPKLYPVRKSHIDHLNKFWTATAGWLSFFISVP